MIGIMGGTFNPVHYGHLIMCEFIREEFGLDEILFVPAQNPPHKEDRTIADSKDRLEMVRLAIQGNPHFKASDIEMSRPGPSYTVDTLLELSGQYSGKLCLIIGADSLMMLDTWRRYEEIVEIADIIVARRPDTDDKSLENKIDSLAGRYHARIRLSEAVSYDYSSTEIRNRVRNGLSIKYWVPEKVEDYIIARGLYREKTVDD